MYIPYRSLNLRHVFNMSVYDVITSRSQFRHFSTPTTTQRKSGSGGPVIDHLLFLSKTAATLEGMYIFIKKNIVNL